VIITSPDLDAEVLGTSSLDVLTATAWRGGSVVAANLQVTSWSLTWDATGNQVCQGRATLTVADPDGTLSPWGMGDPLGPGGSRVQLAWTSGASGIRVPLGMWRIRSAQPSETWRSYGSPGQGVLSVMGDLWSDVWSDIWPGSQIWLTSPTLLRVSGGGSVVLSLEEDVTSTAALCRIDGDAPVAGATALTEMKRLLIGMGAVDATFSPADVTIPASYATWPEIRTDAIGDLLDMLSAVSRVAGDGSLQVVPRAGVGPVWLIQGGNQGALIGVDRQLNDTGVYNAATSKNATSNGTTPLVGHAYMNAGPLAYGGPYGQVPIFHQAIATDQSGVTADAASYLATVSNSGTVDLAVECLAHPALQVHDIVTLLAPTVAGDLSLNGRVVAKTWGSESVNGGCVASKSMKLTVRVTAETLEMIARRAHG